MQLINDLSGYEINSAGRWEPLKNLIIGPGALLEKALTIPTASPQGLRYKTLIEPTEEDIYKNTLELHFTFLIYLITILTLASETLWQAPHRWPSSSKPSHSAGDSICSLLLTDLRSISLASSVGKIFSDSYLRA